MMRIKLLSGGILPTRGSEESAGLDLYYPGDNFVLQPSQSCFLPLAFKMKLCPGMVGIIVPRSSRGIQGLSLTNTVGVIDSDYRGEVQVHLTNRGENPIQIYNGERIAQMIVFPVWVGSPHVVDILEPSVRAEGGFGSTG